MATGLVGVVTATGPVFAATELVGAEPALSAFAVGCVPGDAERCFFG